MLCQSFEALKERCAVSRQDLGEIRQGTQAVIGSHDYIMRILGISKKHLDEQQLKYKLKQGISDQSKRANEHFFEALSTCDTC